MKIAQIILIFFTLFLFGCADTTDTSNPPTIEATSSTPVMQSDPLLKIATWNIEHLRAEEDQGDVRRSQEDYERLAKYAQELEADIIALQEVDGVEAAQRVFSPDEYEYYFSSRTNPQLTGFAVRKELNVTQNPDFSELGLDGNLRYGTDITVKHNNQALRLLSIHLKSFCFDDPLDTNDRDCRQLHEQVGILEGWIDARAAEEMPFVVLGDFNRRFDSPRDDFWPEIDDSTPANADLSRVTEDRTSQCWNGRFPEYIDHIVLDKISTDWLVDDSFNQLLFSPKDARYEDVLSDHCPISIELNLSP